MLGCRAPRSRLNTLSSLLPDRVPAPLRPSGPFLHQQLHNTRPLTKNIDSPPRRDSSFASSVSRDTASEFSMLQLQQSVRLRKNQWIYDPDFGANQRPAGAVDNFYVVNSSGKICRRRPSGHTGLLPCLLTYREVAIAVVFREAASHKKSDYPHASDTGVSGSRASALRWLCATCGEVYDRYGADVGGAITDLMARMTIVAPSKPK